MNNDCVITGIGAVTPLGNDAGQILSRLAAGDCAAEPAGFDASAHPCRVCARVGTLDPRSFLSEPKLSRLMSRDALLAVAAAHAALQDASLVPGRDYPPEAIGLYGSTGVAGIPLREVAPLVKASASPDGQFDHARFGQLGLRAISPLLSFKILSNMPVCFVSICENIQGPNAIYTPWEGQGVQAIEAGMRAITTGDVPCVLVGGCDSKTHELAFLSLHQQGLFRSWQDQGIGLLPAEGAVFLVLESAATAAARGVRVLARLTEISLSRRRANEDALPALERVLNPMVSLVGSRPLGGLVSAADDDPKRAEEESRAMAHAALEWPDAVLTPKRQAGNLFAAAAPLQAAVAALTAQRARGPVLANCFGHGSEQGAMLLEPA